MTYTYTKIHTRYGDWDLYLYLNTDGLNANTILNRLEFIGCLGNQLLEAKKNLEKGTIDTGLTYSNYVNFSTVMVIAKTSSVEEFCNSFHHELQHLLQHMMFAFDIKPWGEPAAYLAGDTASHLYPFVKKFLCDCGRKKREWRINATLD